MGENWMVERLEQAIRGALGDKSIPLKFVSHGGFKLDDKESSSLLQEEIIKHEIGFLVIDALAEIMDGDENKKEDTLPVFTRLRRIANETNTSILVLHNSNKKGGYRGSSSIKAAVDLMVRVEGDEESKFLDYFTEKNRHGKKMVWAAKSVWTDDKSQFYLEERESLIGKKRPSQSQEYVLRFLRENGPSTVPEIMASADTCSDKAAKGAVYSLARDEIIYRTNPGVSGPGNAAIYDSKDREEDES